MEFSHQQNVELRLAQIRSALVELTDIQTQLHSNASESKSDIQASFSRQLETLRSREVYLLSQVDTLLHIKQERLHLQVESLKKELGALEVLRDQAGSLGKGVALQDIEDIMKRIQQMQLVPEEDANVEFDGDAKQLKKAIMSFGSINPKRQRLDKEGIMGPFEQFAGCQVWLMKTPKSGLGTKDDTPDIVFPIFLEKQDTSVWLRRDQEGEDGFAMVTSSGSEKSDDDDDDNDSFVVVANDRQAEQIKQSFDRQFASILNSPNVQWIRPASSKTPTVGVSRHQQNKPSSYYRPSGSTKDWLRKPPAQETQAMDTQASSPICSPSQVPAKPIEIEDLAELACVQDSSSGAPNPCGPKTSPVPHKQRNQEKPSSCCSSSSPKPTSAKLPTTVDIDQVCKGNEKCQTFDECLCDDNCADVAMRGTGFSGVPESSKNQWLIRTPPGPSTSKGVESEDKNGKPATLDEEMPKDDLVKDWLASKTTPSGGNYESKIVSSFLKWQLEENPTWLMKEEDQKPSQSVQQQPSTIIDRNAVDQWLLHKAEEGLEEMVVDNKNSSEDTKKQSEWLFPRSLQPDISDLKVPAGDSSSRSWLQKGRDQSNNQSSLTESKQDVLQEKWLMKQAFGRGVPSPRASGFPYYGASVDVNQWLKK